MGEVTLRAVRARREGTGGSYRSRQREAADRRRIIEGDKRDCLRRLARCTRRGLGLERQYHRALAEAAGAEAVAAAAAVPGARVAFASRTGPAGGAHARAANALAVAELCMTAEW